MTELRTESTCSFATTTSSKMQLFAIAAACIIEKNISDFPLAEVLFRVDEIHSARAII